MATYNANNALTANRAAIAAAQSRAAAQAQAMPLGSRYESPDWLESYPGMASMPTPGENGYGPEPSLAEIPYGASGGTGAAAPPTGVTDPTSGAPGGSSSAQPLTSNAAYNWLVAWVVLLIIMALIIRTNLGYRIVYYALALTLLFLLVTNAQWIAAALSPFNQIQTKVSGQ